MTARLVWERDGRDWPNRAWSRFVFADGLLWHVQVMGAGPVLLLLHGSGASTHTWRDLAPILARRFLVIAPDLPGQGFSHEPRAGGYTLDATARGVAALMTEMKTRADVIVGHSAGVAVAVRMALDALAKPRVIIGLNAALLPFAAAAPIYSGLAKLLALNPFVPWAFARYASGPGVVERLLGETGSRIDARGVALYRRLAGNAGHVAATLRMMANWTLPALERDLPKLTTPLELLVGSRDRTIAPERAFEMRRAAPHARITQLAGLGHLAHEEKPDDVAARILDIAREHGVLDPPQDTSDGASDGASKDSPKDAT
jgi:magnesium chelatase accessory protein